MIDKTIEEYEDIVFPIFEDGVAREATREERITVYKLYDELHDGEYISSDGKLEFIEKPLGIILPVWDSEMSIWKEGASRTDLILSRKDMILKYDSIKQDINRLEMLSEEFESEEALELLQEQLLDLKKHIDDLHEKIKNLQAV